MNKKQLIYLFTVLFAAAMLASCGGGKNKLKYPGSTSTKTGMSYKKVGMTQELKYKEPAPAPGLILIPGGTFIMGGGEKDIEFTMDNRERQVTVMSFYLDETEIANIDWKEFLRTGLSDSAGVRGDEFRQSMYPDTNVWRRDLAFNDPIAETYFSHPAFNMFPVVGISWHQANEYCKWRTNMINSDLKKNQVSYPSYRLPTEAEWEYAARANLEGEIYTWEGKSLRTHKGQFRANFKRGRGDYAGWQGGDGKHYTDGFQITAPVGEFYPNDFGLYNMAGNVAEWTSTAFDENANSFYHDLNPDLRYDAADDDPESFKRKGIRGGSWKDVGYYLQTGTRTYEFQDSTKSYIGFRCALTFLGRSINDF
jgi:gliding motility-associated lipoprotein GldJ